MTQIYNAYDRDPWFKDDKNTKKLTDRDGIYYNGKLVYSFGLLLLFTEVVERFRVLICYCLIPVFQRWNCSKCATDKTAKEKVQI